MKKNLLQRSWILASASMICAASAFAQSAGTCTLQPIALDKPGTADAYANFYKKPAPKVKAALPVDTPESRARIVDRSVPATSAASENDCKEKAEALLGKPMKANQMQITQVRYFFSQPPVTRVSGVVPTVNKKKM